MPKAKIPIICDWSAPSRIHLSEKARAALKNKKMSAKNISRLYKYKGTFKWHGTRIEKYKQGSGGWSAIVRQTLIGSHGEKTKFHLRYFEIATGGYSSFETHKHEHVVICIRGKGRVLVGRKTHEMNFLDTLYISPNTPHQLKNPFKTPFGFFCIVNAKRDKPKILNPVNS